MGKLQRGGGAAGIHEQEAPREAGGGVCGEQRPRGGAESRCCKIARSALAPKGGFGALAITSLRATLYGGGSSPGAGMALASSSDVPCRTSTTPALPGPLRRSLGPPSLGLTGLEKTSEAAPTSAEPSPRSGGCLRRTGLVSIKPRPSCPLPRACRPPLQVSIRRGFAAVLGGTRTNASAPTVRRR